MKHTGITEQPEVASARTRFAVFGNPVAQSLSPLMIGAAFAEMGVDAVYSAIRAVDAVEVIQTIRQQGLRGASVTIPFKETIVPLLDAVDPDAAAIGAVNTVVNRGGRLTGYNTDGPGFIADLAEWLAIPGRTFVILGAGGAACAAVQALLKAGAKAIVVNRTPARAQALAGRFGCRWAAWEEIGSLTADCLINTTPLGMFPAVDVTPLAGSLAGRFPRVMDMIYHPVQTKLLREAAAAGAETRSGMGMFVGQGAEQIRLWTGLEPPLAAMRERIRERLAER